MFKNRKMFKNRTHAAILLIEPVKNLKLKNPVVVALPRGGVPMGNILAEALNASLELIVPRKIGHPSHAEYAIGAIAENGPVIWNTAETELLDKEVLRKLVAKEKQEAARRRTLYGLGKNRMSFQGKDVLLIDDGMATGLTMRAAIKSIRDDKPTSITVAIPVSSKEAVADIQKITDNVICLETPDFFASIGAFYKDFPQTTDDEVVSIMKKHL